MNKNGTTLDDLLLNVSYSTCKNITKELKIHHRSNTNMNSFRQNIGKFSCHIYVLLRPASSAHGLVLPHGMVSRSVVIMS